MSVQRTREPSRIIITSISTDTHVVSISKLEPHGCGLIPIMVHTPLKIVEAYLLIPTAKSTAQLNITFKQVLCASYHNDLQDFAITEGYPFAGHMFGCYWAGNNGNTLVPGIFVTMVYGYKTGSHGGGRENYGSHAISTSDPTDNTFTGYSPTPDNHFAGIFYFRYYPVDETGPNRGSSWFSAENLC